MDGMNTIPVKLLTDEQPTANGVNVVDASGTLIGTIGNVRKTSDGVAADVVLLPKPPPTLTALSPAGWLILSDGSKIELPSCLIAFARQQDRDGVLENLFIRGKITKAQMNAMPLSRAKAGDEEPDQLLFLPKE